MNIVIIGTGYVGLTTGCCLAEIGHQVTCVDNDAAKIALLEQGVSPIYEPGLPELIASNRAAGRLHFTSDITQVVKSAEIIFICVNTPPRNDGQADLKYVEAVARELAGCLDSTYRVIVDKSTVPVHTAERVRETIARKNPAAQVDVISNPEFLREGSAISDTLRPDRIVIGADTERAANVMLALYKPIIDACQPPVRLVSVRSAELIKHGANSFLATKISFANLIAYACEQAGANAHEVLEAMGLDQRIGSQFLRPGIGFGGSCFPKDLAAFKKTLSVLGVPSDLLAAVENINALASDRFLKLIERELWVVDAKEIAILGLSFKPDTDDIRNSPALKILEALQRDGARLRAYDPQAMEKTRHRFPDVRYCADPYEAAHGAEAIIVCTEWPEFTQLDLPRLCKQTATAILFDGRNAIHPDKAREAGFQYYGIGFSSKQGLTHA